MKRASVILPVLIVVATAMLVLRTPLLGSARQAVSWLDDRSPGGQSEAAAAPGPLVASGIIEARTLDIGSVGGGRIAALHVVEGQRVAAGDVVAEMDVRLLEARLAQAQAESRPPRLNWPSCAPDHGPPTSRLHARL